MPVALCVRQRSSKLHTPKPTRLAAASVSVCVCVCVRACAQVSKALPERQLEMEGLLRELESLQAQLDELSAWASSTRARLENSTEEPPTQVVESSRFVPSFPLRSGRLGSAVTQRSHTEAEEKSRGRVARALNSTIKP